MHLLHFIVHDIVVAISFIACIIGLALLWNQNQHDNDLEATETVLLRMSFSYWLVYCMAFAIQKIVSPELESLLMMLKMTTVLSYFLTFSCVIILPLHKFAVHHIED
ncbi:MAG: hypothetical protein QNJ51_15590 [Calothrix sp. MO_167.B12]|nr:hypothetical protein [Calothrix sp. MO_167.B12]